MSENYDLLRDVAERDVIVLEEKGKSYGSSWRSRGGIGAFMMLARKWDRIENQMEAGGYDIFEPLQKELVAGTVDGLLDDVRDLRRYLLLVEGHVMDSMSTRRVPICAWCGSPEHHTSDCDPADGEPGPGYVNQDPDVLSPTRPRQA